jgi:hypothetical protein
MRSPGHLQLGLHALSELSGRLLKGGQHDPAPLRQTVQVRIAAERSMMANLAQKVAHTGIVLHIPGCQVQWQPLDLEGPRCSGSPQAPVPESTETWRDRPLPPPAASR